MNNTWIYNFISVPHIRQLLLGDTIISSKADPCSGSQKEKRSYGKVRNSKPMSTIWSFIYLNYLS